MQRSCSSVHCECPPVHEAVWSASGSKPSEAIIEGLAAVEDTPSTDLPPMHDDIDLEALDRLFESTANTGMFRFTVRDWNVFVCSEGRIQICDQTERGEPSPVFESATAD